MKTAEKEPKKETTQALRQRVSILEKQLQRCLEDSGTRKFKAEPDRKLWYALVNLIAGALRPVTFFYEKDEAGVSLRSEQTIQHIFWAFHYFLLHSEKYVSEWANQSFREAVGDMCIGIESLPSPETTDFDYENLAGYFLGSGDDQYKGFLSMYKIVENLTLEEVKEIEAWDIEASDIEVLRLTLRTITECQSIWLNRIDEEKENA
jgi:hypothetical protein